jgi:hypothetical protein
LKQKYHDAVQSGNQTAAAAATSDLRALLASSPSTATAPVPDVQPAAASLRTPSGITTPDVLKAESGSGLPADIEKAMQGRTLQDNTIQPLPKSKDLLETGKVYQTARGPAVWDGQEFIAQ